MTRSLLSADARNRTPRQGLWCFLTAGLGLALLLVAPVQADAPHAPQDVTRTASASSPLALFLKHEHKPWLHLKLIGKTRTDHPLFALIVGNPLHTREAGGESRLVILLTPALDDSGQAVRDFAIHLIQQWSTEPALMQHVLLVFFLGRGYRPQAQTRAIFHWPNDLPNPSAVYAQNLLLAQTPTTQAWLKLFVRWHPDLVTEITISRKAAWRDGFLFGGTPTALLPTELGQLAKQLTNEAQAIWGHADLAVGTWMQTRNPENPAWGVQTLSASPRHILGYSAFANVPAFHLVCNDRNPDHHKSLLMTRMISNWITLLARKGTLLLRAEHHIATEIRFHYGAFRKRFPIYTKLERSPAGFLLRTYAYTETLSPISGTVWTRYEWNLPRNYLVPRYSRLSGRDPMPELTGYMIPAGFPQVISILRMHGIQTKRLLAPLKLEVQTDRLSHIQWGRSKQGPDRDIDSFNAKPEIRYFVYPAGSVFVPIRQPLARLIYLLLDIQSPLNLYRLGYFSAIFKPLHIRPQGALETLARTLLRHHPHLARRFLVRIMHSGFSGNPSARLDFFYRYLFQDPISPSLYPVDRLPRALPQTHALAASSR